MNGRTAKLLRKVAREMGNTTPRHIRSLKRWWYSLNRHERTKERKNLKAFIEDKSLSKNTPELQE